MQVIAGFAEDTHIENVELPVAAGAFFAGADDLLFFVVTNGFGGEPDEPGGLSDLEFGTVHRKLLKRAEKDEAGHRKTEKGAAARQDLFVKLNAL